MAIQTRTSATSSRARAPRAQRFRSVPRKIERQEGGRMIRRHCHSLGYVSVIVEGKYQEAGDNGRRSVGAGDVLVHDAFESHADWIGARGAMMVNIPLRASMKTPFRSGRVGNLDRFMQLVESGSSGLLEFIEQDFRPVANELDWPDLLALALRSNCHLKIADWAEMHGLAPETASRGFRLAYDVSPKRYRATVRARSALRSIQRGEALADVAYEHGYADQSHLCRGIRALTGAPPSSWLSSGSKTNRNGLA